MKMLVLILSIGFLYAQTPAEWWHGKYNSRGVKIEAGADSSQKAFAEKCYEFGKQYGRGHTLAAIAWMESSLGKDIEHDERSIGPFGISYIHIKDAGGKPLNGKSAALFNGDFEDESSLALQIFEDNIRYFRRLGYSPREAYFWGYPRYNAGKNWRRFRRRGEVFRARVNFLTTQFK